MISSEIYQVMSDEEYALVVKRLMLDFPENQAFAIADELVKLTTKPVF